MTADWGPHAFERQKSTLTPPQFPPIKRWGGAILGLIVSAICLACYLRTIAPGLLGGDAGELQFVPYILSLAHPTGYPLQTLLGKLWATIVPVGSVAFRMNLLSALLGAATVGLVFESIRLSTSARLPAFFAALLLGISEIFWGQAILADKYTLNAFLLALVLWALVRWSKAPTDHGLRLCAFFYGVSLTHHRSIVVLFPFLVMYWFWRDPRLLRQWRSLASVALLMFLPLLLYLWLPIGASRGLPPGTWRPAAPQEWLAYILDRGYLGAVRPAVGAWQKLVFYGKTLLAQFGAFGILLGLIGVAHQIRTRNPLWVFVSLAFASQAVLAGGYEVPRQWVFFLPSFVLFSLWIGEGLKCVLSSTVNLRTRWKALYYGVPSTALALCAILLGLTFSRNYPTFRTAHVDGGSLDIWRQDLKEGYLAQRFVENSLPFVEPNAIVVADWEQSTPLWYLQQVEGCCPGVTVIYPIDRWPDALATGRPTYLSRTLPGIGEPYHLTTAGALVRVSETPISRPPADIQPKEINWENKIELVGYRFYETDFSTGYVWPLSLYFRTLQPMNEDCSISVRVFSEAGNQVWAQDRKHFVLGMYPTTKWSPGEIVGDYFEMPFPRGVPAGRYYVRLILYTSASDGSWHSLTLLGSNNEVADLCPIDVPVRR